MKFSFRKGKKPTGLNAIGSPNPDTAILLKKKEVGLIVGPSWQTKDSLWQIRIMLVKEPSKEDPAPFQWATFKSKFETEPEAREFIRGNLEQFLKSKNATLHSFEDLGDSE